MPVTRLRGGRPPETSPTLPEGTLRGAAYRVDVDAIRGFVVEAMRAPVGLPPLNRCLAPGDQIAVAVGHTTPLAGSVVLGVVAALEDAGVAPAAIRVVAADPADERRLRESLSDALSEGLEVSAHNPDDEDGLCFAGMTRSESSLFVNRDLYLADVVLPISAEATDPADESGFDASAYAGLFPDFFDRATIDRCRGDEGDETPRLATRRAETDEAGWLIGAPIVLRVAPGPDDGVAAVVAGDPTEVLTATRDATRRAWSAPLTEPADVVLAVVAGEPEQQTWSAVARALENAEKLARPGGVLALWTELDEPINDDLAQLVEADHAFDGPFAEDRDAGGEESPRRVVARRIAAVLEENPVFLRSRLPADDVEALGFAPVADESEMRRLVGRFADCTVVEGAQHVRLESSVEPLAEPS